MKGIIITIVCWSAAAFLLVQALNEPTKETKQKTTKEKTGKKPVPPKVEDSFPKSLNNEILNSEFQLPLNFSNPGYRIYHDSLSKLSTEAIQETVQEAAKTEALFGVAPNKFLKNISFVYDKKQSYFDPQQPRSVFISSFFGPTPNFLKQNASGNKLNLFEIKEATNHETCHLLDHQYKFSDDADLEILTQRIILQGQADKLLSFLYLAFREKISFYEGAYKSYANQCAKRGDILVGGLNFQTDADCSSAEIFAQTITSLDSYNWEDRVRNLKKDDTKLYDLYTELLITTYNAVNFRLENPTAPVLILLQKRIKQLQSKNLTAMLGIFLSGRLRRIELISKMESCWSQILVGQRNSRDRFRRRYC